MSDDDGLRISRRKIVGSAATVGAAAALGGAGTGALLWDEEKFGNADTPNVLSGGELDLKVDWEVRYYDWIDTTDQLIAQSDLSDQPGPIVNLVDVKPGDVLEATLSAHLYGNPGFLGFHYEEHADTDNGITEPEDKVDGHTPNDSDGNPFLNSGFGAPAALMAGALPGLRSGVGDGDVASEDAADTSLSRRIGRAAAALGVGGAGLAAASGTASAQSGLSVTDLTDPGLSPQDLAETVVEEGGGVSIEDVRFNPHVTGDPDPGGEVAAGTFTGGGDIVGIEEGIILSSGRADDIEGSNQLPDTTTSLGTPGTDDLDSLSGGDTLNATVLEIDFTVPDDADQVFFNYVFGSEEYNEYVGSEFNDVFGFFINGENRALVPDPDNPGETLPAAINNINNGSTDFNEAPTNPDLYINNDPHDQDSTGTTVPEADLVETEMDGFTVELGVEGEVDPDGTNTLRMAVADTGDTILDSWVLIEGESLTTEEPDGEPDVGELDDVMRCVVWYDDGNNIPEEIWTGDTQLGDPGPEESLDPATQESYVMEVGMAQEPSDIVDTEAAVFAGTLAEMDGADVDFDAGESIASSVADTFEGTECYQNSDTEYIGFLCWVPRDIPGVNDNVIQTDRLEFQFGFDAIQCRHNVANDGGPIDGTIDDADAENNANSP